MSNVTSVACSVLPWMGGTASAFFGVLGLARLGQALCWNFAAKHIVGVSKAKREAEFLKAWDAAIAKPSERRSGKGLLRAVPKQPAASDEEQARAG
jgi:hypothetical protein